MSTASVHGSADRGDHLDQTHQSKEHCEHLRVTFQTGGNTRRAAAPAGESARPMAAPARDWRNAMAAAAAALKTAAWLG